jgi:hypothetical protein
VDLKEFLITSSRVRITPVEFLIWYANLVLVFVDSAEISADTIVFLTSEKRPWIGGRYINATWDMPQLMAKKDEIVAGDKLKVRLDF